MEKKSRIRSVGGGGAWRSFHGNHGIRAGFLAKVQLEGGLAGGK